MQQLLVFIVCEYLWPFLLPWRGWEDSSILPALIKSVDYPAFASVQILSLGSTADDPLGAFSLLRVGMVPLQPLGSHPTSAIVLQLLSNPFSPRRSHFSLSRSGFTSQVPSPGRSSLQLENLGCGEGKGPLPTLLCLLLSSWHEEDLPFSGLLMLGYFCPLPAH